MRELSLNEVLMRKRIMEDLTAKLKNHYDDDLQENPPRTKYELIVSRICHSAIGVQSA